VPPKLLGHVRFSVRTKTVLASYSASCSTLMDLGCKETVHPRYCHVTRHQCNIHFESSCVAREAGKHRGAPKTTRDICERTAKARKINCQFELTQIFSHFHCSLVNNSLCKSRLAFSLQKKISSRSNLEIHFMKARKKYI